MSTNITSNTHAQSFSNGFICISGLKLMVLNKKNHPVVGDSFNCRGIFLITSGFA